MAEDISGDDTFRIVCIGAARMRLKGAIGLPERVIQ
jgi:hypothetical protein